MQKVNYYKFWKNLYPDIENFNIIENLYRELNNSNLSDDTVKMIEKLQDNSFDFQNDDLKFYLKHKNNFSYKDEHQYFEEEVMYYNFYKPYVNFLINQLYLHEKSLQFINIKLLQESLEKGLLKILAPIGGRVLIRETEVKKRKKELVGDTKRDRFLYFNNKCLTDDIYIIDMNYKYPILFEILKKKTIAYTEFIVSALNNIQNDYEDIKEIFNIDMLNTKLIDLDTGAGDEHNNGKAVMILVFENEEKILYKPRNLQLDYAFNKLLEWLNDGLRHKLKGIKILNKNEYGYAEFIKNNSCNSEDAIKRYYERAGYILALIYSLNGSDLHYENIIANGEHPIIIDLETLFNPKSELKNIDDDGENFALEKIYSSVLTIGMLPLMLRSENITAEYGGFGADKEQVSPFKTHNVKNRESDDIKVECINDIIGPQKNNPILNDEIINSKDYIEEIVHGFEEMYELIINNKDEYKTIVNKLFDNSEVRVLLRSTMEYSSLLEVGYHPDLLMDYLSREVLLCRIGISENVNALVKALEYRSLVNGDIPYFTVKTNELYLNSLNERIDIQSTYTSMEYFFEKIDDMCEDDLRLQKKFIYNSYLNRKVEYSADRTYFDLNNLEENKYKEEYLNMLKPIADYVINEGIVCESESDSCRIFIGSTFNEDENGYSDINYVGRSLYDGQAGISLFLTYCGKVIGDKKYYSFAKEILVPSIKFIENADMSHPYTIGAFSGNGGEFFALYKLYALSEDETLKPYVKRYLQLFENIINKDRLYDVVSGSAGFIHILISLLKECKDKEIKYQMEICIKKAANHLIDNVTEIDSNCMTWSMKFEEDIKSYTGFGHGNAGIISALARYSKLFSEDLSDLIKKVLNYEDLFFNDDLNNWYRDSDKDMVSLGWCHGAPGILLNKLILIENGFAHLVNKEKLKVALKTTMDKSFGNNPSLCHGDLGNLEILCLASKVLKDKILEEKCMDGFAWIFKNVIKERWKGCSFRGIETFGLMIGLTGFGYSIIKFNDFENIPSILYFS